MSGIIYDGVKAFSLKELSDRGWKIEGENQSDVDQLYRDTAWLYAVIQKRAGGVTSIPRVLLKGETEVEEEDLPFTFDINDMLWRSSLALDLYAKAYLLQLQNQFKVLGVRWFHPETITLEIDEVEGLKHFKRHIGVGRPIIYKYDPKTDTSPDGLVWVWESGLAEVGPGIPKADVAEEPAKVLRAIDQHTVKFFNSAAIGQYFFTAKTQPNREERNRFRKWVKRVFFGGIATAFGAEVFGEDLTPHKLGADPKDLEMTELDRDNRRDISAVYDTPEALVTGDAGSMSRATLDRITSNWINGPIMQRANMIVDAFNHHILVPAGYELTLNAEAMTVNQEEERQRALAYSLYYSSKMPPDTIVAILGIDGLEGMELEDKERIVMENQKLNAEEDDSDLETDETESDKALELAKLRRYIKNGKHLKRSFTSDILTPLEIAGEVGKAPDAPFLDWESYP